MDLEPCTCQPLHISCDAKSCKHAPQGNKASALGDSVFKTPVSVSFSRAKLSNAASAGCVTCEALQVAIVDELTEMDWEQEFPIQRTVHTLDAILPQSTFEYFRNAQPGQGCKIFPPGNARSNTTASDITLTQCRVWIDKCLRTHPRCGVVEVPMLPVRVVDIGDLGQNKFSPRLYETNSTRGKYVALSHCWGINPIITTTKASLNLRKESIVWSQLPKTFQDALTVTGKLGLRYIWIDSLCIIQDDVEDWEKESAKMGSIFEDSLVTIAAVKAADGRGGCFGTGYGARMFVPFDKRNMTSDVYYRQCSRHEEFEIHASPNEILASSPLFGRAWTLQEELLAPRVLYYTEHEVVWQCRSIIDCQCGRIADRATSSSKLDYEKGFHQATGVTSFAYQWSQVIRQYSVRKITKETDRLPALSGIAKVFQSHGLGDYIAGHWLKSLPLCLTWATKSRQEVEKDNLYVAPSWSWASVRAGIPITFSMKNAMLERSPEKVNVKTQILDLHYKLASTDLTGAISSAYIIVVGLVVKAQLDCIFTENSSSLDLQSGTLYLRKGDFVLPFAGDFADPTTLKLANGVVQCLVIFTRKDEASFLVLSATPNLRKYRRLGAVTTNAVKVLKRGHRLEGREQTCLIMDTFFKSAERQELILI